MPIDPQSARSEFVNAQRLIPTRRSERLPATTRFLNRTRQVSSWHLPMVVLTPAVLRARMPTASCFLSSVLGAVSGSCDSVVVVGKQP